MLKCLYILLQTITLGGFSISKIPQQNWPFIVISSQIPSATSKVIKKWKETRLIYFNMILVYKSNMQVIVF